jgi:mannose-6-phosphate isomerase-like protein (cupin superfamily)
MTDSATQVAPIALGPGEGEALWFLGALATIKSSAETTGGRVAVVEHLAPHGSGSPLHVHHREDEWFYVLEGELTFWVGGAVTVAAGGAVLVTEPAGFEGFMRAGGVPAERLEIPPAPTGPPDVEGLTRLAASFGIEIVGPPGIPG